LAAIAEYADIWAPHFGALVTPPNEPGTAPGVDAVVAEARRAGLGLHPYTFRLDAVPAFFSSLAEQLEFFYREVGVDAVFCDHPDVAVTVRDRMDSADPLK